MADQSDNIVVAQFSTTTTPSPPSLPPAMPKAPSVRAQQAPSTSPQSTLSEIKVKPRDIQATDLLEKAGFGAMADVAIVSVLSLLCSLVLFMMMRKVIRMGLGSEDDSTPKADTIRKQYFDLKTREGRVAPKLERLEAQADALQDYLDGRTA